ncbi:General vesicular transport factor p115 [Coccomyxa sp. Obi]|nr:General vesicular transport factor p115 [Coccomyxa sp. Obi]
MNVLGKVARGVGGYIVGADGGKSEAESVQQYLQRISDGDTPEERQDAVAELRDLLEGRPEAQAALGNGGFPVLINALRNERGDLELMRGVLECLAIAVQPGERESHRQGPDSNAINAELLAKSPDTVPMLLGFLDEEPAGIKDFYVRYHTVQLLTALAAGGPYRLQGAILAAPMGVVRLMDLLGDAHEVIRNEAILLLAGLTRSSADIQKIVAFEGAFERVLQILEEEGWSQGGIIVQDCTELLNNLLRNNPANQLMFRETGHLSKFASLLRIPERSRRGIPRQVAANLLSALATLSLLITLPPPNVKKQDKAQEESWAANRATLMKQGALDLLLALAVAHGGIASPPVRGQALVCVERLISGMKQYKEALMSAKVIGSTETELPALQAILQTALRSKDVEEATAAEHVLQAFCRDNAEGQRMLAATLTPVGDTSAESMQGGAGTFGGELVSALMGPDARATARAAAVLADLLRGNAACKQQVLATPLEIPQTATSEPVLLLPQCCRYLSLALSSGRHGDGGISLAVCSILRLLITWAQDCPPAVDALLMPAGRIPMLLDLTQHKFGARQVACTGLAAVLLGVCLLYSAPTQPADSQQERVATAVLSDIISSRIGLAAFFGLLDALKQDPHFVQAASGPTAPKSAGRGGQPQDEGESSLASSSAGAATGENPFDHEFAQWLPGFVDQVHRLSMDGLRRPSNEAALADYAHGADELQSARAQIADQQRELEELRKRLSQSNGAAPDGSSQKAEREAGERVSAAEARARQAEAGVRQAEADAAAARAEVSTLRGRLEASEREAAQLRNAAEEARAAAAKLEADLEGLSGAYNSLETHSFTLEARLRQLESSAGSLQQAAAADSEIKATADDEEDGDDDDGMNDLLICLGQEEQKVDKLRAKLEELGVDVDSLLEGIGNGENDDEDGDERDLT